MNNPFFYMPTKVIVQKNAIKTHGIALSQLGKTALIVTGRNSSKTNGSLKYLVETLQDLNISYYIYDEVEENPSLDTVKKITDFGKVNKVDFVIGLGGGSPIDAAKAASVLINNHNAIIEDLFQGKTNTLKEFGNNERLTIYANQNFILEFDPYSKSFDMFFEYEIEKGDEIILTKEIFGGFKQIRKIRRHQKLI